MVQLYFTNEHGLTLAHVKTDQRINAWQGKVLLPHAQTVAIRAGQQNIIWQAPPHFDAEAITFSGGVAGGVEGDTVLFSFLSSEATHASYAADTRVYLSDGKGTEIIPEMSTIAVDAQDAKALQASDTTPPEFFSPTLYRSKDIFGGEPVVIFSTTDSQSGIAGYEIREHTTHGVEGWHTAQSPYLIHSDVRSVEIKALDYAGNERIQDLSINSWQRPSLIIFVFIVALAIGYTVYIRWRRSL